MNAIPKLELKHISPYLPYGLTVHSDYNNRTEKIVGICQYIDGFEILTVDATKDNPVIWSWKVGEFRPYLRPLSDLTKEIEHNGGRFTPLFELFKLSLGKVSVEKIPNEFKCFEKDDCLNIKIKDLLFGYDTTDNSFCLILKNTVITPANQHLLFFKLAEWHFDFAYNLIDQNLAIPK